MSAALDGARAELFAAPFAEFVAVRKRLVGELRAAGHKAEAAELGKAKRPSLSAWTANQLWRRARGMMEELFAAAAKVRRGDYAAVNEHRGLLARLQNLGADVLRQDGQATTEPTMRRLAMTLQALAASGGFAPDRDGELVEDRDPPGFDAMAGADSVPAPVPAPDSGSVADSDSGSVADSGPVADSDSEAQAEAALAAEAVRLAEAARRAHEEAAQAAKAAEAVRKKRRIEQLTRQRAELERDRVKRDARLVAMREQLVAWQAELANAEAEAEAARKRAEELDAEWDELHA